jgi:hypothetical protein
MKTAKQKPATPSAAETGDGNGAKPGRRLRLDTVIERVEPKKLTAIGAQIAALTPDLPYTVTSLLQDMEPHIREAARRGVGPASIAKTLSQVARISERQLKSFAKDKSIEFLPPNVIDASPVSEQEP